MPTRSNIHYRNTSLNVSAKELEDLFRAADLGGRVGDKIRRAFLNSQQVSLAYDGDRLIGASRAISDGEYHAFIYDVAVHPDYQKQGVGQQMLQRLLAALPVWRIMLRADEDVQAFYGRAGFMPCGDIMALHQPEHLYDPTPTGEAS
ncbi:GNAT family N-acetyltransferase [Parachitinimonas caeni]|uniref:GNAT family N-acetyltransferase n=1 Tax=Parachitinimonas caeni TaxID=3031301 RepID=A0ABT7DV33_9NEIS|nr:GNAT family N-acetyltransferase [Parachitinimonas caeni]MDK2123919.1 GNAT family N-acetyltransferase [Parachitinimonas caeni]